MYAFFFFFLKFKIATVRRLASEVLSVSFHALPRGEQITNKQRLLDIFLMSFHNLVEFALNGWSTDKTFMEENPIGSHFKCKK